MSARDEKPIGTVNARLKLYSGPGKRAQPICSGYRPTFWSVSVSGEYGFDGPGRTSGNINIRDVEIIQPGEEKMVTITFVTEEILGADIGVGSLVYFAEGREALGEAVIL